MSDKFNHIIQGLEQFTKDLAAGNLNDYRQYQFVREGDKLIRVGPNGESYKEVLGLDLAEKAGLDKDLAEKAGLCK
jgi:hypothetical protein